MNRALLCETVTGRTMGELLAAREAATDADMVELRLDGVTRCDAARAINGRTRPVIVTCRPVWEGGHFEGAEEERGKILFEALNHGAEFVDVEWRALSAGGGRGVLDALVDAYRSRIVLSTHDFVGVPPDLLQRARAMRDTGSAVIKVAIAAAQLRDTLPLLEVAAGGNDAVVIGMGDLGVPSRILATRFGSRWTYTGRAVAPGQIPAATMVGDFRVRDIGHDTTLYGFAAPHSLSSRMPAVLNRAFAAAGMDAVCVPLATDNEDDISAFSDALNFAGVMKGSDAHHHV